MPAPPQIIDTRVHSWDLARFRYPWFDTTDPVEETKWLESLLTVEGEFPRMVCVCYADLRAPDLDNVLSCHDGGSM